MNEDTTTTGMTGKHAIIPMAEYERFNALAQRFEDLQRKYDEDRAVENNVEVGVPYHNPNMAIGTMAFSFVGMAILCTVGSCLWGWGIWGVLGATLALLFSPAVGTLD